MGELHAPVMYVPATHAGKVLDGRRRGCLAGRTPLRGARLHDLAAGRVAMTGPIRVVPHVRVKYLTAPHVASSC